MQPADPAGNAVIRYTPALGFAGTDTFTYTLTTDYGSSTGTVTVDVAGAAPTAADDSTSVTDGQTVDIGVLRNDSTVGFPVTDLSVASGPAHGTAKIVRPAHAAGKPTVRYTPELGFAGTDSLTYTLTTAYGSSTATVTVDVAGAPPAAVDDTAHTRGGKPVTVDVTANDNALGFGPLTVRSVGNPAHGSAEVVRNEIVYTPATGFVGTDHMSYVVATAYGTDTATLSVVVDATSPATSTPTTTPPPASPTTPPPTSPTTPPNAPNGNSDGTLASTGVDSAGLLELAGGLLFVGAAATAAGGRRRRRRAH